MTLMDIEEGVTDIIVADNLVGTSVTPPNLSVGADLAVAPDAATASWRVTLMATRDSAPPPDVGREVCFGIWNGHLIASGLPFIMWKERWV